MMTTYLEAIRLALGDALAADPRVFIYGQDIAGGFGGAFKATKGLAERFPGRVLNSPISEDAMTGLAIGAALDGMRPVVEYQFADFASVAFNQIANHAGTYYWRTGHPCPVTLRLPGGGTPGGGPFHSQMVEGWLSHHPGVVVLSPATVADAYQLLRDAINCPDPVAYCEHKHLYNHLKEDLDPAAIQRLPMGKAAIRRAGDACTLISYGAMVHQCLQAAETLAAEQDVHCEVIDLRCVRPLDGETILASLARTGRVVVASEAWPNSGIVANIMALIAGEGFTLLDAPPKSLCAHDVPVPYHPALFHAFMPDAGRIAQAVVETLEF